MTSAALPLAGRSCVVTGASSGIGEATVRALAAAGAGVVAGARRRERLEALVASVEAAGGRAVAVEADVTRRPDVEALAVRAREAYGGLHVWVNNAGLMPLSPLEDLRVDDWERMVDVNLKGVLYGLAAALPPMIESGGGHIVNVGSLAGRRPFPGGAVYSATKFAVRALTWGMHLELGGEHNVRVTDVQPGVVDTELPGHIPSEETRGGFYAGWKGKRQLHPDDVARAVVWAVTQPDHVAVNEILVRPTDQRT